MTFRSLTAAATLLALSACSTTSSIPSLADSQWTLIGVDGQALVDNTHSSLGFNDDLRLSGNAGCNNFFGGAEIKGDQLTADHLGVTKMACLSADAQQLEATVLATFNQPLTLSQQGDELTLSNSEHTLTYQRQAEAD